MIGGYLFATTVSKKKNVRRAVNILFISIGLGLNSIVTFGFNNLLDLDVSGLLLFTLPVILGIGLAIVFYSNEKIWNSDKEKTISIFEYLFPSTAYFGYYFFVNVIIMLSFHSV